MFELRDYQVSLSDQAITILNEFKIVCFSVEVRCGKTLMSLETARKYGASNVLFVSKLKALSSIVKDYHLLKPGFKMTAINYESIHKVDGEFDFIIVDECHKCGAFPVASVAVKGLRNIIKDKPCILMSGTFTPESFSQIYHILSVSQNTPFAEYANFYKWANEFVIKKKKYIYNREIIDYSNAKKDMIDNYTKHLFISYTQTDAGFEQLVKEEILYVKMQPSTYFLANKLKAKRVHIGKDGQEIIADTEVKLMQKLHQIFSGSCLTETGEGIAFDMSKVQFIKERFAGQKIAIFYKFKAELGMIYWIFGGSNVTSDPEKFNNSTDKVFACQVQSGREGINLSTADALVMLNICFSAVSYWQSRARLQTKDRTKEALIYWIFAEAGIEEKIYEAVSAKKDFTLSYFKKSFLLASYIANDKIMLIE